jgi:hypothetical protein
MRSMGARQRKDMRPRRQDINEREKDKRHGEKVRKARNGDGLQPSVQISIHRGSGALAEVPWWQKRRLFQSFSL